MLTIKETDDKKAAQRFLQKCGCAYELGDDIVMTCEENNEIVGVTSLRLEKGKVYLNLLTLSAESDDISLRLGLAKSVMNLADLRGIKEIYGTNKALEQLYKLLRFKEKNGEFTLSLEGYFTAEH